MLPQHNSLRCLTISIIHRLINSAWPVWPILLTVFSRLSNRYSLEEWHCPVKKCLDVTLTRPVNWNWTAPYRLIQYSKIFKENKKKWESQKQPWPQNLICTNTTPHPFQLTNNSVINNYISGQFINRNIFI